jgi:hypothetical protein
VIAACRGRDAPARLRNNFFIFCRDLVFAFSIAVMAPLRTMTTIVKILANPGGWNYRSCSTWRGGKHGFLQ